MTLMVAKDLLRALACLTALVATGASAQSTSPPLPDDVYPTYGVHNDAHSESCAHADCTYKRAKGEPTDPQYPAYWTSHWKMYRVFNHYAEHPPPYDGKPPEPLRDGVDYQATWGTTYFDSTWKGPTGTGAMEEDYDGACLPIFPFANNYSCSFVSLGAIAFFVTYEDRPSWMPEVCLFSPRNPPPTRDFIKHLPYSQADSDRLQGRIQGYGFWVGQDGKPMQTGVSPDQTAKGGILFGYAFDAQPTPDRVDKSAAPYLHPSSFYFSGVPLLPKLPLPNAPIVSQNYTDFSMTQPNPAVWAKVASLDPSTLPKCRLYNPPQEALGH